MSDVEDFFEKAMSTLLVRRREQSMRVAPVKQVVRASSPRRKTSMRAWWRQEKCTMYSNWGRVFLREAIQQRMTEVGQRGFTSPTSRLVACCARGRAICAADVVDRPWNDGSRAGRDGCGVSQDGVADAKRGGEMRHTLASHEKLRGCAQFAGGCDCRFASRVLHRSNRNLCQTISQEAHSGAVRLEAV